ncbi:MAG TPA: hypothetical protein VGG13_03050 [Candidatus Saccharimonadales bacterium]|jgi:SAM-dependent methyltransferase
MQWFELAASLIVLCFAFVLVVGPPYVPTLSKQAETAMDMVDLRLGETLLELGSGDGKILLAAAKRGWKVVGFELNPILVFISYLRTWRYRGQVKVVWGNFWNTEKWPPAEGIFVFILQKHMKKLDTRIAQWHQQPIRLVSFAFTIPDKKPAETDKHGVYLYEYT